MVRCGCNKITGMENTSGIPVIGFYGFSHSGKTSLIYKIVQTLQKANIQAGVIKRTDKAISSEPPGKDTAGYRAAGAKLTAFLSTSETSFVIPAPLDIPKIIDVMDNLAKVDLIIIEGAVTSGCAQNQDREKSLSERTRCLRMRVIFRSA